MVTHREQRLGKVSDRIDRAVRRAEDAATDAKSSPQVRTERLAQADELRTLYTWLETDLPKWPLPASARRTLSWSVLVPAAYSVIALLVDLRF
jgi:hypothetical protein